MVVSVDLKVDDARWERLASIFATHDVRLACLFGSSVEPWQARDVDLAVWFATYSFDCYLDTLEAICQALGTRRVDLVVLNRANVLLRLRALLSGIVVFAATPMIYVEVLSKALVEYDDDRYFLRLYRQLLAQRCEEGLSVTERRIDQQRVEGHLSTLDDAMAHLRRLRQRYSSFDQFQADVDTRELCVHYLRIALEAVLDICRHYLAVVGVSLAELDTTNLIELAGEKGLLEMTFARRIRGMAGMRNAIVHVYWRLDYVAIYRVITEQLIDLDEFARQTRRHLPDES
jgi:uncharacterized protein YutE (UPF0331/DUF86 family)